MESEKNSENLGNLSPLQRQAIAMLATGHTRSQIAQTLGISRRSLYNWQTDADFDAALDRVLDAAQAEVKQRLTELATDALDCLRDILQNPEAPYQVRAGVALKVLDLVLDQQPKPVKGAIAASYTTPAGLSDSMATLLRAKFLGILPEPDQQPDQQPDQPGQAG